MTYQKMILALLLTGAFLGGPPVHSKASTGVQIDTNNTQTTSRFYESMLTPDNTNMALLNLFFTKMPKGGDIHHHYDGSIYAETYLEWVGKKGWYIDKCTLRIVKEAKGTGCELLTPKQLMNDSGLYQKLLMLWSNKDYGNHYHNQPPPDSNFFNTFLYFGPIAFEYIHTGLKILKERALKENVNYIETILSLTGARSSDYFEPAAIDKYNKALREAKSQKETDLILDAIASIFLQSNKFKTTIDHYIVNVNKIHQGIDDENFTMRYQAFTIRVLDPMQVFTDLFSGYIAADKSPLITGVNIVAPENNRVALADYTLHMRMYNYLMRKYPKVHRALHAGELTLGMVRPKNLTFHIQQARDIADAQRIGHGVDLPYEKNPVALLKDIKENAVIEINFSSNEFILGVKGDEHPYLIYSRYDVPLVIATDDSGVSRNNLSHEYVLLATRYHPTYERIKKYVYNSITYSFLKEEEKASLLKDLDKRFLLFEKEMANLYRDFIDH